MSSNGQSTETLRSWAVNAGMTYSTYGLKMWVAGKSCDLSLLVAWHGGRTSVCGRRTFPVLHTRPAADG